MNNTSLAPHSLCQSLLVIFGRIPSSLIALIGRFSIAAIFWQSGQTKISGLSIDLFAAKFEFGRPHITDSAVFLFQEEYRLPFLSPNLAALLAAGADHFFPVLLLLGLGTRFAALALLTMTLVIQIFVYPDAYSTHGVWATVLLLLVVRGGCYFSLDHLLAQRYRP